MIEDKPADKWVKEVPNSFKKDFFSLLDYGKL